MPQKVCHSPLIVLRWRFTYRTSCLQRCCGRRPSTMSSDPRASLGDYNVFVKFASMQKGFSTRYGPTLAEGGDGRRPEMMVESNRCRLRQRVERLPGAFRSLPLVADHRGRGATTSSLKHDVKPPLQDPSLFIGWSPRRRDYRTNNLAAWFHSPRSEVCPHRSSCALLQL